MVHAAGCYRKMSDAAEEEQFEDAALVDSPYVFLERTVNSSFQVQLFVADQLSGHPCFLPSTFDFRV